MKKFFSLLMILSTVTLYGASVSVSKQRLNAGESLTINYAGAPANSYLYVYKDAALLPLTQTLNIETGSEGKLHIDQLTPGYYCVKLLTTEKTLDSAFVNVSEYAVPTEPMFMLMTDIHVMHPDLIINDGEAFQNTMNSDRKMLDKSFEIFSALVDTALLYKPQALLIAGDLTKDGEKIGHEWIAQQLHKLEAAGINCFVIPGNHDVKNPGAVYYDGDKTTPAADVLPNEFMSIYKDFGYDGTTSVIDPQSMSYATDLFDGVRLIGIDATRWYDNRSKQHGDDSNVSVGYGKLKDSTLEWVLNQADEARKQNKMVVALMHHQMLQHFNMQEAVLPSATIEQGDSIARVFMQHGIRLIMTGHMHIGNISTYYNEAMTDSLCEISTGATVSYPSPYRFVGIDAYNGVVKVQTHNLKSIPSVSNLGVYGREEIKKHLPQMMTNISSMFLKEIDEVKALMENEAGGSNEIFDRFFKCVPSDNKVLAQLCYEYLGEPFGLALLTCSEGNEPEKQTDTIRVMTDNGLEQMMLKMMEAEFNKYERPIIAKLLLQFFRPKMTTMYDSTFGDYSYYETEFRNRTDDLYPTLLLAPAVHTALSDGLDQQADDNYYDILGKRYTERPTAAGVYIHNGEKLIIR